MNNIPETYIVIFVANPCLFCIINYGINMLFLEDFEPYNKLADIRSFNNLRIPDGNGFKRYLAAIQYEQLKRKLLNIFEPQIKILGFIIYCVVVCVILYVNNNISILLLAILACIVNVYFVQLGFQVKLLERQIGGH